MSIIQRIRERGAWIVFGIIALALIAFILQDSSFRGGGMFSNTTTLAKVNGEEIDRNDFEAKMEMLNQMNGGQIQREQLMPSVWNMVVEQTVMQQEFQKLGISFGSKELNNMLFGSNPPQWLRQGFTDPNTGVYDSVKVRQQFVEMKKRPNDPQVKQFWTAYIQPTIDQALQEKYQNLLTKAVYVPKWMGEKYNADNNSFSNIRFVSVPYGSVDDAAVKVTDEEINAYVKKHEKEFTVKEASRSIAYVSFSAAPTAQDSAVVYQQLESLKTEFAATDNAQQFINMKGSETPFHDGYVTASNLKVPNADVIKQLPLNEVYGPYVDGTNYTIAKMVGKRMMPDSVKVRHILINFGTNGLADSTAKKRIDSIATAIKGGADFNQMVLQYSDDPGSKDKAGEYEFSSLQFPVLSKEFADVAFYGNAGDKKTVKVENSKYTGYHYIEVLQQKNMQDAYKIAYVSKPILPSDETVNAANTQAQQFAAAVKDRKSFDALAEKDKTPVLVANDIKELDYVINGLGSNRQFVRWIYENDVDDISEPTQMDDRIVVAVITSVNKPGLMNAASARPMAEPFIKNEKKAKIIIDTKIKGQTLEAIAQAANSTVTTADSLTFNGFVPNVGNEPKLIGAAFNKSLQNKISGPIAGNGGVYVLTVSSIGAQPGMADVEMIRQSLMSNIQSQMGYRAMGALKESATIKDYRSKFY